MRKIIYLWMSILCPLVAFSQTTSGELKVTVTDSVELMHGAIVTLYYDGSKISGGATDSLGTISFKPIPPGKYTVKASFFGVERTITGIGVNADRTTYITVVLSSAKEYEATTVIYREPLIKPFGITTPISLPESSAIRDLNSLVNKSPMTVSQDGGGLSIVGTRPTGNKLFWNGVPLQGSSMSGFPIRGIQNLEVMLGGISAEYGDFLGGGISFTTPRPGTSKIRSIEYMTSSLFDKYHNNYVELFSIAPLYIKDKGRDNQTVKLGYMTAANFQYQADRSPSAVGVTRVKEEKLKELEKNPLRPSPSGAGYIPAAEFINQNDLENVSAHQNVPATTVSLLGELNFVPTNNLQMLLGAKYDYLNAVNYNFANNLFNSGNNSQTINHNILTYLSLTHILRPKKESAIKNAYYTIRLDYQGSNTVQQDPLHKDNFFDYGYIGRFTTYNTPGYEFRSGAENGNPDSVWVNGQVYYLKNYYRQAGNQLVDTLVRYDRTNTRNPLRSNYTSQYYDLLGAENINSMAEIRSSGAGLVNGQNPSGIYSNLWNNVGLGVPGYSKSNTQQAGINATGQITTKNHELRFGLYFEQRAQRSYNVNANNLWTLMGQLANNGLELDTDNPQLMRDENGIFKDTVQYGFRQSASQSEFDKRLREKLMGEGAVDNYGRPMNNTSFIDVHSYNPSDFSLSLFSADELLNNGNNYVNYFGYDYLGNKQKGNLGIGDFTGNSLQRPVSAYTPSYMAVFAQDRITFKGFTLRAGLRVERFDNNLPVLKDPYLLYAARTAGEVSNLNGQDVSHPDNIAGDYAVYVNDARNPTQITGYRNNNTWYNATGQQINDPAAIAEKSEGSTIQPYLVNPNQNRVNASAFTDFEPEILVLPRLYFDFPLPSEKARFFASYDVLAQRPGNNFASIAQYYYLPFNSTEIIGNPNLKPQRSYNYEVGFRLKVSENSILALTAAYREQRNLIQLYRFNYAYPVSYTSFSNIDFSTIKAFSAQYIFKNYKQLEFDASYTLQFADGTGSSAGSQQALVSVGQPNLRTLFPLSFDVRNNIKFNFTYTTNSGDEYKGPVLKGNKLFQNMGVILNLNTFSGLPFTPNQLPTANAQSGAPTRSPIKGTPFGSRLPWQLQNDLSLYKNVPVKLSRGSKEKPTMGMLRFSIMVSNFINIKNQVAVHPYTGSSESDGWLASEQGQKAIQTAANAQSFVDLYNAALSNPGYYSLPRRIRLGISLNF